MANFQLFTTLRYDPALCQLGTSRIEHCGWNAMHSSPFYMLEYHRDRMLRAATHWAWTEAIAAIEGTKGLSKLETLLIDRLGARENDKAQRVKILLSAQGELEFEFSPVPPTTLANLFPERLISTNDSCGPTGKSRLGQAHLSPPCDVFLDNSLTQRSEHTHHKTTRREGYDQARQRAGIRPIDAAKEVLLVDATTNSIMEGSVTTPYFWRAGHWVTPPVAGVFSLDIGSGGQDGTTRKWALERGLAVEGKIQARDVAEGDPVWLSNGIRGFVFGRVRVRRDSSPACQ